MLDLIRFPVILTGCTAVIALVIAPIQGGPGVFEVAAGFVVGLAVIYFSTTLVIGGLGLLPTLLRRALRRLDRPRKGDPHPGKTLWDDWVDGP
ncbi:hypothetical protein [Tautonia plasticadhaerens]|uniref:Uncharacterized protein n=1 Tax=Tautonia plasticadhaerens TaxID=2527974 RepID=A0A518H4D0_9BACT|nr:hypothetical protein [Tautonia plasticadhaerens]QDV35667.1 hypothetical protein ElP_35710 [Tautonia plasticadhaerens]